MSTSPAPLDSRRVWKRIEEATDLLGIDPSWLLAKAGWSRKRQVEVQKGQSVPELSQLMELADASGFSPEFFLSEYRAPISPAKFRSGSAAVGAAESEYEEYYQRKAIIRLATLADLVAGALGDEAVHPFLQLRQEIGRGDRNVAGLVLRKLKIAPRDYPIGPKLLRSIGQCGVQTFFAGIYHKARIIGLSWWQRGVVPVVASSSLISVKRSYFTIAHELIHLLLDLEPSATGWGYKCIPIPGDAKAKDPREERRANELAAQLLMPDELYEDAKQEVSEHGAVRASRGLGTEWEVSTQAAALRLCSWRLTTWPEISELFEPVDFARISDRPQTGFGTPERTQETLRALYQSGVSARYLARITGIPLKRVLIDLGRLSPSEVEQSKRA